MVFSVTSLKKIADLHTVLNTVISPHAAHRMASKKNFRTYPEQIRLPTGQSFVSLPHYILRIANVRVFIISRSLSGPSVSSAFNVESFVYH
jgi:hypothetical protein